MYSKEEEATAKVIPNPTATNLDQSQPIGFNVDHSDYTQQLPPPYEAVQIQQDTSSAPQSTPPSYGQTVPIRQDVTDSSEAPPPSYESLYGRVQAARSDSSGTSDFLKKFVKIIVSTIGWVILLGIISCIPVAGLVLGIQNLDNCPVEPKIPVYLIVSGIFSLLVFIGLSMPAMEKSCTKLVGGERWKKFHDCTDLPLGCGMIFVTVWFFIGNYWVYENYNGYYNVAGDNYQVYNIRCDKTTYLFAFWTISLVYMLPLVFCCCVCFAACVGCCIEESTSDGKNTEPEQSPA